MAGQGSGGNVIAAICNFFIPGLGHLVQGRILGALFYFVTVGVCYALAATVVLAIVFWPVRCHLTSNQYYQRSAF